MWIAADALCAPRWDRQSKGSTAQRNPTDRFKSRTRNTRFLRLVERAIPRLAV